MSKKHFIAFAETISKIRQRAKAQTQAGYIEVGARITEQADAVENVCVEIFSSANPRFDVGRFREACK